MIKSEKKEIIRKKIAPKISLIQDELAKISDSEIRDEGEKLHRQLSILSVEDLFRPFTI